MKFALRLLLLLVVMAHSQLLLAQSEATSALLEEAKGVLKHPEKIPAMAQKLQGFFSDPKNRPLFDTPEGNELAQVQHRFINYLLLAEDLTISSCNLDRTKPSERGFEILLNSLSAPQCSEVAPAYFEGHSKVTSLMEEIKIIEEGSYVGEYAINEAGNIVYPWELSEKDKEKYEWKQTLAEVVVSDDGKVKNYPRHDPPKENFVDELYRQSLTDTFATYMHLQTTYGVGNLDAKKIAKDFCAKERSFVSKLTGGQKNVKCPQDLQKFLVKEAQKAINQRQVTGTRSFDGAARELNGQLTKLNELRKSLDKNATYLNVSGIGKRLTPRWIDEAKAKKDYAEYQRLYTKMISSGPGLFVATDELSSDLAMKPFEPMSFVTDPQTYPVISGKRFKSAVEEAQELTFDHGQELLSVYHEKVPTEEKLKNLLRLNPAAASNVLLNNPIYGSMTCNALRSISLDEDADRQLRLLASWGGTIVGGALLFTGIGSGAGASMIGMGTAGAVVMVPEMVLSYQALEQTSQERNAALAEGNGAKAQNKAVELKKEKTNLTATVVLSGSALLFDINMAMRGAQVAEKTVEMGSYVQKVDDFSASKVVTLSESAQLRSIEELGSLRVDVKSLTQAELGELNKIVTKPVDELMILLKTSQDPKIQRAAFEALKKYTRGVAGDLPSFTVLEKKIPNILEKVYYDTSVPDDIRKLAHQELRSSGKVSEFVAAKDLKVDWNLDASLNKWADELKKAEISTKETLGAPISEMAKRESYPSLELTSSGFRAPDATALKGQKAMVKYQFRNSGPTYEIQGEVIETYPTGIEIKTSDGTIVEINNQFGIVKEAYLMKPSSELIFRQGVQEIDALSSKLTKFHEKLTSFIQLSPDEIDDWLRLRKQLDDLYQGTEAKLLATPGTRAQQASLESLRSMRASYSKLDSHYFSSIYNSTDYPETLRKLALDELNKIDQTSLPFESAEVLKTKGTPLKIIDPETPIIRSVASNQSPMVRAFDKNLERVKGMSQEADGLIQSAQKEVSEGIKGNVSLQHSLNKMVDQLQNEIDNLKSNLETLKGQTSGTPSLEVAEMQKKVQLSIQENQKRVTSLINLLEKLSP